MPSRRRFLGQLTAGSLGLAAMPPWTGAANAAPAPLPRVPETDAVDERYWEEVKAQFPLRPGITPMNAANLCPASRAVLDAQSQAQRDIDGDVSFQNRAKYEEVAEATRGKVAADLGVTADEIALVRNTSEANNIVVAGAPLTAGDEVLVFDQNHPTNNVAWDVRAKRNGFTVRRVPVSDPQGPAGILDAFRRAVTTRTRLIAFSDVSNTTGVRLPTGDLCAWARERGIYTHVDGAQTWGALAVNLAAYGCDSYAASAHKWPCGPKEVGLLYVRGDRIPDVWPGVVGVGWGSGPDTEAEGARKFETLGQRDDSAITGLGAALDFRARIGPQRIETRVLELAAALREGLTSLRGARPVTPTGARMSAGVTIVRFEGTNSRALFERLYRDHGIAGAPTGGVRLSAHVYNTVADVERAVAAVREMLRAA
jgi:isopenicillin-N epimerase